MNLINKAGFFLLLIIAVMNLAGCDESKTPRKTATETENQTSTNENSTAENSNENNVRIIEGPADTSPASNTEKKPDSNSNQTKPVSSAADKSDGNFTKTVKFNRGKYARTYTGKILADIQVYVLGASSGQTLNVSSDEVDFTIVAPGGGTLHTGSGSYAGTLPADGNYRVTINDRTGSLTKYSITFAVF